MDFTEHAGKELLAEAGIAVPQGRLCRIVDEVAAAVAAIGPAVVKAQVPAGRRGKAGGVVKVAAPDEAADAAARVLGMSIGGHVVEAVRVEAQARIARELYAAVISDAQSRGPLVLFSTEGGMEIEEVAATRPGALRRAVVDIGAGFGVEDARALVADAGLGAAEGPVAETVARLYRLWCDLDAELIEINPLAILDDGSVVALDCKLSIDDASAYRQEKAAARALPPRRTALEERAKALGLTYIELDGDVGVLANGAGLTMTTMDVISHLGGSPANFMEIGGDAYTKATPALEIVLAKPGLRSLVVNFCGAFARTDVMAQGVVEAFEALRPTIPAFFSIHGTGEEEAVALIRDRLGLEPFERMEDAMRAAVEAGR